MSDYAIQVRGLGKQYQLGEGSGRRYKALRDVISGAFTGEKQARASKDTFWALQDVSFDVPHGEVLGVIGRNGAGKSTLLKILTRITEPTMGEIRLRGRVGSLLEVGTGFHPELTGRENIYLNGAILGMRRREIARKFDEIVDFAEIEQFIDTPAKRYSSGMYMRLAFAVAAHLDPEILLVDEVLAVGDAAFQKKCLGKMGDVARSGRTVLFVSHNMAAIESLCHNGLMLDTGKIVDFGTVKQVIDHYLEADTSQARLMADLTQSHRSGNGRARIEQIEIMTGHSEKRFPATGEDIQIHLRVRCHDSISTAALCIVVYDILGNRLIDANTNMANRNFSMSAGECAEWVFRLKNVLLHHGRYRIELFLGIQYFEVIDSIKDAMIFEVVPDTASLNEIIDYPGVYRCNFEIDKVSKS